MNSSSVRAATAPSGRAGEAAFDGAAHTLFADVEGRIVEIDAITDPERVRRIAAAVLTDE